MHRRHPFASGRRAGNVFSVTNLLVGCATVAAIVLFVAMSSEVGPSRSQEPGTTAPAAAAHGRKAHDSHHAFSEKKNPDAEKEAREHDHAMQQHREAQVREDNMRRNAFGISVADALAAQPKAAQPDHGGNDKKPDQEQPQAPPQQQQQQQAPLQAGPVTSRHRCYQLDPTVHADALGEDLGTSHYCVIENICVRGDQWYMFDAERAGKDYEFPRQPLLGGRFTHYLQPDDGMWRDAVRAGRVDDAGPNDAHKVTVMLRHAYCCSHPKHFLEPIPTLHSALRDLEANATRRAECGLPDNFKVQRVAFTNGGELNQWTEMLLKAAVGGKENPLWEPPGGHTIGVGQGSPICYRRAVVPGAIYHLFQSNKMAAGFREAAWARVAAMKAKASNESPMPSPAELRQRVSDADPEPDVRRIVYARRGGRRTIVDEDVFVSTLKLVAAEVNATVERVQFGSLPAYEQGLAAHRADILIGMHGADLTNLLYQRRGSTVVEMNHAFFFEPAFREMSKPLFVWYDSWTCTAPSCAFGGNRGRWDSMLGHLAGFKYDMNTRQITFPNYPTFNWPIYGYPEGCEQCDKSSCCTPLAPYFFGALRDDNVMIGEHKDEVRELLFRSFRQLGWVAQDAK